MVAVASGCRFSERFRLIKQVGCYARYAETRNSVECNEIDHGIFRTRERLVIKESMKMTVRVALSMNRSVCLLLRLRVILTFYVMVCGE